VTVARSLRWRLTIVFSLVAGVAIAGSTWAMVHVAVRAVWSTLDASLEEEAETLVTLLAPGSLHGLHGAVRALGAETDEGPEKFIVVHAADGRVVGQAGWVPHDLPSAWPAQTETVMLRRHGHAAPYRVVRVASPRGEVFVGVDAGGPLRTVSRLRSATVGGALAVVALLAVLAWSVTSRATRELDRLAEEMERIEARSLHLRLPRRRTLEVDRVVRVLNRALARLEDAMSHLQRFTADAAHELRTPVAALRATLEVALTEGRDAARYRDGIVDGIEQAERLASLAEDLLTLSALETSRLASRTARPPVRLDALVREVAEAVEPMAQEQSRTFHVGATAETWVRGDRGLLQRLLLNVLDNAFRHTPSSASIRVDVRVMADMAVVEVADTGPGIAAEELPFVFERFRHGTGAGHGAGLGLALCQEIATGHGGRLTVDSTPGAGTTVRAVFPCCPAPDVATRVAVGES
jgi:signal transduction histidine kinase